MELKDILKDIIDEINKRFTEYRKDYFKFGKVKIDKSNGHHIIDVQIIPFYQNDNMNVNIHLYIDYDKNEIELRKYHKYKNAICIYRKYIDHVSEKKEPESTGIKELDNWLKEMNKSLSSKYDDNPLFDKDDLVDMFMGHCKEYFLAAEKYYENKKIADKLYEDMKRAEYKI